MSDPNDLSHPLLSSLLDFVWGRTDETEYLKKVVEEKNIDSDLFRSKVQTIQGDLNIQLRKGVCFFKNYTQLIPCSLGRRKPC